MAALKDKTPEACLFYSACAQPAALPLVRRYSIAFQVVQLTTACKRGSIVSNM